MWQRFTERARKVVFYAQEAARRFGEGYVSTEHLLIGLVQEPENGACRALSQLGFDLRRVQSEVEKQLPRANKKLASSDMTLTPRAKRVIDLAYNEARSLGNNFIGTEHLLLGLIREGDGLAGRVLKKLGARLSDFRIVVASLQNETHPGTASPAPVAPPAAYYPYNFLLGSYIQIHLVLAAIGDEETVAGQALRRVVEDVQGLQGRLWNNLLGQSKRGIIPPAGHELANVLRIAQQEADAMNHDGVHPFHILIAAASLESTEAGGTLVAEGATAEKLREAVLEVLGESAG